MFWLFILLFFTLHGLYGSQASQKAQFTLQRKFSRDNDSYKQNALKIKTIMVEHVTGEEMFVQDIFSVRQNESDPDTITIETWIGSFGENSQKSRTPPTLPSIFKKACKKFFPTTTFLWEVEDLLAALQSPQHEFHFNLEDLPEDEGPEGKEPEA